MSHLPPDDTSLVEVRSFFVRHRNALFVRAHFAPLYLDYYLHAMQHSLKPSTLLDEKLKDLFAAITLHSCSRPHDETCAWTVHLQKPLANFFVTAVNRPGRIAGRVFTEDVSDKGKNLFITQVVRTGMQTRQSIAEFSGDDMLSAAEQFYTQSEQRLTRYFRADDEQFIQVSAEPDCDEEWLSALTDEDIANIDTVEHLTPLETRGYVFHCGCAMERLYPMITRLSEDDLDHIFADGVATIHCPRCGASYHAPREHFDEWMRAQPQS